jgi:outer membrane protein OmpA-like peptidoglycan-associated protein
MKRMLWMAASLWLATGAGMAQEQAVLTEGQVTQQALVDALTPTREVRTRSLRVRRDDDTAGPAAKPASASLLITFETNSAALTSAARQSLDVVGAALTSEKLAGSRFAIEGHADPRGLPQANLKLSQARAESVREYLLKDGKIDTGRIEAVGKGDRELMNRANPAAPENRRVTIVNLSR